jgi:hypothetical protein
VPRPPGPSQTYNREKDTSPPCCGRPITGSSPGDVRPEHAKARRRKRKAAPEGAAEFREETPVTRRKRKNPPPFR